MFKALLIDADDTLFDFPKCEEAAFKAVCAAFGLPFRDEIFQEYSRINRAVWDLFERGEITLPLLKRERFTRLLAYLSVSRDADKLAEAFTDHMGEQAFLLDGAEQAARDAAALMPVVLVTNGIATVQRSRLARTCLPAILRGMVISEAIGVAKPDPRVAEMALELAGVSDPAHALFVGDSLRADIACANAAGVKSCWFNPRHLPNNTLFKPDYEIHSLSELRPLLEIG